MAVAMVLVASLGLVHARMGWATNALPLVLGPGLGLYVKRKASVLEHPTRVRIYRHLLVLPGDHFRSILRTLRLSVGAGRHHLSALVRAGLIREEKHGGRCRYYPKGLEENAEKNALFAKHWTYRDMRGRVLLTARALRESRPSSVAAVLGISRQLAAYHLRQLERSGLLKRDGKVYRP